MFRLWRNFSFLTFIALGACSILPKEFSQSDVSNELRTQTGFTLPAETPINQIVLPEGISVSDELDLNQLALISLWNNANFRTLLVDIKLAQSDLIQAGLLPNPELMYSFQTSNKPYKYALELPIEAIWLRPIQLNISSAEAERVSNSLQQAGLDLIRDVRQATIELVTLRLLARVQNHSSELREEIAEITEKRLVHGDISEAESLIKRTDATRASQDSKQINYEVQIAEQKLLLLLGLPSQLTPLKFKDINIPTCDLVNVDVDKLIDVALQERPDIKAAHFNISANKARSEQSNFNWLRIFGIADATSGLNDGHTLSPAFRFTLPIFNWNQGNRKRASAEFEKSQRAILALNQQVESEIRQHFSRFQQGCSNLYTLKQELKPQAEMAEAFAALALEKGDISYLQMLESRKQVIDIQLQEALAIGILYKSWADLDRSSGHQLSKPNSSEMIFGFNKLNN